ncbi:MAG TPA: sulfurtransferase TusA family protein [Candidatus Glassbacteria bacterium]|nr:sulfurtransferase TusA family protein [Candidatus Glassbacteria bacterium]
MSEPLPSDETLDTTGLFCPLPVVKTAEKLKGLETGSVLEVISDDGGIEADLPAWCAGYGHDWLGCFRDGSIWRCYVRKTTTN